MAPDITQVGTFSAEAQPSWLSGLGLMHSATARKLFVVVERKAVPLDSETVASNGRARTLSILPEGRPLVSDALSRPVPPPLPAVAAQAQGAAAAPPAFVDGYQDFPAGLELGDDPADTILLKPARSIGHVELALAEGNGDSWGLYARGAALLRSGDPAAAAPLLRAAYESDALNLKALNYYLAAKGLKAVDGHRLPLSIDRKVALATPASTYIAETLDLDLSEFPAVTSRWHLVNLVATASTLLLYLAIVVLQLLSRVPG